jgi:hypothetical protein
MFRGDLFDTLARIIFVVPFIGTTDLLASERFELSASIRPVPTQGASERLTRPARERAH